MHVFKRISRSAYLCECDEGNADLVLDCDNAQCFLSQKQHNFDILLLIIKVQICTLLHTSEERLFVRLL